MVTKTDPTTTKPSTIEPGDAPFDTKDETERVSSVPVAPGQQAVREGTVNAVLVNDNLPTGIPTPQGGKRIETIEATRPDGTKVTITRDLDTGEPAEAEPEPAQEPEAKTPAKGK